MMSVGATLIGGACGVSAVAARGATTRFPKPSAAAQLVLNIARSIPELIFGVIFVAAVGFGPLAGLLALACHSVGMLGKFATEHLEHLDHAPAAALESCVLASGSSGSASFPRSCHASSTSRCIAGSTCAPPPLWGWSAPAVSASS